MCIYVRRCILGVVRSSRDTMPTGSPAAEEILILGSIFRPLFKLCHLFQRRRERERRIEEEKETVPSREGRCHGARERERERERASRRRKTRREREREKSFCLIFTAFFLRGI